MSEALRLADHLDHKDFLLSVKHIMDAAEELRRLHAENAELAGALRWIGDHDLSGCDLVAAGYMAHGFIGKARAALAKVETNNE